MPKVKRKIISIAHSYCVALNRRLAHEMAREGGDDWDVTAVAPSFFHADLRPLKAEPYGGPGPEPCSLETVPVRFSNRVPLMLYGGKLRELLKNDWDVVHGWEEPYVLSGGQIAYWSPRSSSYVFYTFQNLPKRYPPPFSFIERYCLDRCSGWLAAGESVLEARLERGYGRKPSRVLPLGVALDTFKPAPEAGASIRRSLGWSDPGPPVIGYLGRFVFEKGLDFLIKVLDALNRNRIGKPPWRMMFVGGGPMEEALKAWANKPEQADAVRVVTGVTHDQVPAHLCAMDILVAPSQSAKHWKEQLGRMLIEAFACGVPVVASDSGEIPFVVKDAGIVLGEQDQPAWEEALGGLLESPKRRQDFSTRGLERARSTYAWPLIARSHLEFFEECLAKRNF